MEYSTIINDVIGRPIVRQAGGPCFFSGLRLRHTTGRCLLSDSLSSLLDLHLPRFSISASYNLEEILPLIGLGNMFDLEADLSGIMGQLNRTVSRVRQGVWMSGGGCFSAHMKCIGKPRSPVSFLD